LLAFPTLKPQRIECRLCFIGASVGIGVVVVVTRYLIRLHCRIEFVVRRSGERCFCFTQFLAELNVLGNQPFDDQLVVIRIYVLRNVANTNVTGDVHAAFAGHIIAKQNSQHRGLARSVRADKSESFARLNLERNALQYFLAAVLGGDVI
jgi:hypothetical protein